MIPEAIITACLGALGGGGAVKVLDRMLRRGDQERDELRQIRVALEMRVSHLEGVVGGLQAQLTSALVENAKLATLVEHLQAHARICEAGVRPFVGSESAE